MSKPFAVLVAHRIKQCNDGELTQRAFDLFNRWSNLSSSKHVCLEDVAWVAAVLAKAVKAAGIDLMAKHEVKDENGARVVNAVASDGVKLADGAG